MITAKVKLFMSLRIQAGYKSFVLGKRDNFMQGLVFRQRLRLGILAKRYTNAFVLFIGVNIRNNKVSIKTE